MIATDTYRFSLVCFVQSATDLLHVGLNANAANVMRVGQHSPRAT